MTFPSTGDEAHYAHFIVVTYTRCLDKDTKVLNSDALIKIHVMYNLLRNEGKNNFERRTVWELYKFLVEVGFVQDIDTGTPPIGAIKMHGLYFPHSYKTRDWSCINNFNKDSLCNTK